MDQAMNAILLILAIYLGVGICALVVLDILTHRIRSRLYSASLDTQSKMIDTGNYVGDKTSKMLTVLALWMFWPVAIYGAFSSPRRNKSDG